jgi:acyl-homoserine-lactone acylase
MSLKETSTHHMKRTCLLILLLSSLSSGGQRTLAAQSPEILWDTWGVPHINAKDSESLFYAFGWAQMQSHGNLLLRLYGQARGRGAEYGGEEFLASDKWVRTMGVPARARAWYAAQPPDFRRYLDAFAEGINDYAKKHEDRLSADVKPVLPVTAIDVLAHEQRVINFTFVSNEQAATAAAAQLSGKGSNGWAIAPQHSAGGHAMLLANPHLPWFDLFLFYEAQLTAPGIDAYGVSLVGFPVLGIAFNDNLGWTHTVNPLDGSDLYALTLAGGGYRFDGQVRPFETEDETLRVKQKDGSFRVEKLTVKRSIQGPVIAEGQGRALALRVAGLDRAGTLAEWWEMCRARNLSEFETALKRLQLPTFNVVYADRNGHIMYLFNGLVPVRAKGGWDFWNGIVPGDSSATLWTRTHPYRDLPRIVDPPSHWVQNANDPPWTATFPSALDPARFPAYMAPHRMDLRPQRSVHMLMADDHISFEEMIADKHSTRMELADRLLDDLIPAARRDGNELARRAAGVLEKWDRNADAGSRGAVLFTMWAREMKLLDGEDQAVFALPWDEKKPLTTPDGLASPKAAVAALESVAAQAQAAFGDLDVAWGDVARLRVGKADWPANGGSDALGIFRVVEFSPAPDGHFRSVGGDSYVAAVEFSNPVRAQVLLSYGNSSQPGSPHRGDQLELFSRKALRPAWRTRAEVEAHLEAREVLSRETAPRPSLRSRPR